MDRLRIGFALTLVLLAILGLGTWAWHTWSRSPGTIAPSVVEGRSLVVYYLHGRFRCTTCNGVEAATRRAVDSWPVPQGATKPILRVVNFMDPGQEQFQQRFQIIAASVLLAEEQNGKIERGQVLFDIGQVPPDPETVIRQELDHFVSATLVQKEVPSQPWILLKCQVFAASFGLSGFALALIAAIALGLITAISPCPLATNVAAISFLARKTEGPRQALLGGFAYALGRTAAYVALGAILSGGLLSIPAVNRFLSEHMNAVLGPILLLVAIPILRLWTPTWNLGGSETAKRWAEHGGLVANFGIGALFALAFCPTSAALFLGGLIPLALQHQQPVVLSVAYGLATAAPVVVFVIVLTVATNLAGKLFQRITTWEIYLRWTTGLIFLGIGLWYTLATNIVPTLMRG